jgi:hypothetical protein
MFLAAKPQVPPTFDGVDYDDNKALKAAQDSVIREQWVQSMMARLVREELGKCYYREGVNHLEKCGHLRGKQINQSSGMEWDFGRCQESRANDFLQTDTSHSSSTRRSRATCSSSKTTSPRSRVWPRVIFGGRLGPPHRNVQYAKRITKDVYECSRARGKGFSLLLHALQVSPEAKVWSCKVLACIFASHDPAIQEQVVIFP